MLETDATLLHAELVKRHVQAHIVKELGLYAIRILQGGEYPINYCTVIGDSHMVSWGPAWEYNVRVQHAELAAPAICRTLPSLCFKPKRRPAHDEAVARRVAAAEAVTADEHP